MLSTLLCEPSLSAGGSRRGGKAGAGDSAGGLGEACLSLESGPRSRFLFL